MYVDQWGEIHYPPDREKEKPLNPSELGGTLEIGVEALSDIGQKVKRYGTAKARNREMAGFLSLRSSGNRQHPYRRLSRDMYDCASWLEFRHYPSSGQTLLAKVITCKKHLLCPVCAIRRGVKTLARYHERALSLQDQFDFYPVALTVKNGLDLWERYQHLKHAFKRLRDRAKKGYGVWAGVKGSVWSTEFTYSETTGWHPHLHLLIAVAKGSDRMRYGEGSQLAAEWKEITGDSFITHVGQSCDSHGDLAAGLCEVLKYALKFSDLDLAKNLEAFETLRGKRLVQASGVLYGCQLPDDDDLLDDPLDAPYEVLFFKYCSTGYRFQFPVISTT